MTRLFVTAAIAATVLATVAAAPAEAGPPFLTDDPEPTDFGHWEICAPVVEVSGIGPDFGGAAGAEVNYGARPGVQVTLGVPIAFAHDRAGYTIGRGDLDLSVKYRFFHDEAHGISIAAFPGTSLPTGIHGLGAGRITALLPIWAQKDLGPWSVFGGGGYAINPGQGNRSSWTGGVAVTPTVSPRLVVGVEADRQGATTVNGSASTRLGAGCILQLNRTFRVLGSAGPTIADTGGHPAFHVFVAGGLNF